MAFALKKKKKKDKKTLHGCIIVPLLFPRHSAAQNLGWSPNVLPKAVDKKDIQAAVNYLWKSWELCGLHTVNIWGNASTQHWRDRKQQGALKGAPTLNTRIRAFTDFPPFTMVDRNQRPRFSSGLRRKWKTMMWWFITLQSWECEGQRCSLPQVFLVCGNGKPLNLNCDMQRN